MKKILTCLAAFALACSVPAAAFAAPIDQDSDPKEARVEINTNIAPTYTVTIPSSVTVPFNAASTEFGKLGLETARLEPGYAVKIDLDASNQLKNTADPAKVIPYTVTTASGIPFSSAQYFTAKSYTALAININESAWNAAYAGTYSDTVTFTVTYLHTAAP